MMAMDDKSKIQIVDVIAIESAYSNHVSYFIVTNRTPQRIYSRSGNRFTSFDSGFYDFLSGSGRKGDAFCGREFEIDLDDGTKFQCRGDVWSVDPPSDCEETVSVGVSTISELERCYVFRSSRISKLVLDAWLKENSPSSHYYKYDPRCTIEWADKHLKSWGRQICTKRARKLRKLGRNPWMSETGKWFWSKAYERHIAKIREIHGNPGS